MKRYFIPILLLVFISTLFSQEAEESRLTFRSAIYDPFFSVIVTDNEGLTFNLSRAEFYDEFNEKKFFFWVRRNSGLYNLSFKNIKRISFSEDDFADDRYKNFTRCTIEMVTGESYPLYLKTTGQLKGFEETFSSPISFYLHYNLIRTIEFKNEGDYLYCPFCENIYFDKEITNCLYDGTLLEEGVISEAGVEVEIKSETTESIESTESTENSESVSNEDTENTESESEK